MTDGNVQATRTGPAASLACSVCRASVLVRENDFASLTTFLQAHMHPGDG